MNFLFTQSSVVDIQCNAVKISRQNNKHYGHIILQVTNLLANQCTLFLSRGLQELWSLRRSWKWRRKICGSAVLTNGANAGNFLNNFALRVIDDETRKVGLLIG